MHGHIHQADQPAVCDPARGCHFRHMCPLDGPPRPHGPVLSCAALVPLQAHMAPSSCPNATCKSLTCPPLLSTSSIWPNLTLEPPCATSQGALHPAHSTPAQHLAACVPAQPKSRHKRSKHTLKAAIRPPEAIETRCSEPACPLQSHTCATRGGASERTYRVLHAFWGDAVQHNTMQWCSSAACVSHRVYHGYRSGRCVATTPRWPRGARRERPTTLAWFGKPARRHVVLHGYQSDLAAAWTRKPRDTRLGDARIAVASWHRGAERPHAKVRKHAIIVPIRNGPAYTIPVGYLQVELYR